MSNQRRSSDFAGSVRRWGRHGLGCLTVFVILLVAYFGCYFLLRGPKPLTPQLIAHRGGTVDFPENTIAAFQHAITVGADWIEFDVQRTRDNILVVFHDETVDRTTNGSGLVSDMTLVKIQGLDAGNGEKVPTFDQVITLASQNRVGIMPEAKSPHLYSGLAVQMLETLEAHDYIDKTVLQSFDSDSLMAVRQNNPELALCPLHGLWQFDLSGIEPIDAELVCPMAEMVLLYPWMIRQAHQDGRKVYVWFGIIERPLAMRIMLAMGADGLMVDDPTALAEILNR